MGRGVTSGSLGAPREPTLHVAHRRESGSPEKSPPFAAARGPGVGPVRLRLHAFVLCNTARKNNAFWSCPRSLRCLIPDPASFYLLETLGDCALHRRGHSAGQAPQLHFLRGSGAWLWLWLCERECVFRACAQTGRRKSISCHATTKKSAM